MASTQSREINRQITNFSLEWKLDIKTDHLVSLFETQ